MLSYSDTRGTDDETCQQPAARETTWTLFWLWLLLLLAVLVASEVQRRRNARRKLTLKIQS